jgi:hypothetical protein
VKSFPAIAGALTCALLLVAVTARAEVENIPAVQDATIFGENSAGANGQGHLFAGSTDDGHARRALIRFDVGSIPKGSLVTSVTLTLQCTRGHPGSVPVSLHRMTKWWTEGSSVGTGTGGGKPGAISFLDVTWRFASFTASATDTFETAGGDFDTTSATTSVGGVGQYAWSTAGLVNEVSLWVENPGTNYGWILIGNEAAIATARRFDSGEDTNVPMLTVEFTPPTPTRTATWGRLKALYR